MAFQVGKGTLHEFVGSELEFKGQRLTLPSCRSGPYTLIAVSGIILMTFSPLPVHGVSLDDDCSYRGPAERPA